MNEAHDLRQVRFEAVDRVADFHALVRWRPLSLWTGLGSKPVGELVSAELAAPRVGYHAPGHAEQPHPGLGWIARQLGGAAPGDQHDLGQDVGRVVASDSALGECEEVIGVGVQGCFDPRRARTFPIPVPHESQAAPPPTPATSNPARASAAMSALLAAGTAAAR